MIRRMTLRRAPLRLAALALLGCLAACATAGPDGQPGVQRVAFPPAVATTPYPTPGSIGLGAPPTQIPATLHLPPGEGRVPAVVVLHGTGGVGGGEAETAALLREAGIAALVPDLWAARGIDVNADARRRPSANAGLPDAFGALAFLAAHPRIDPERIGVMGRSYGAVVALRAARADVAASLAPNGPRFRAFVPFYPGCSYWMPGFGSAAGEFDRGWPTGPMLILAAGLEDYDREHGARDCAAYLDAIPGGRPRLVTLQVYADATHGWDAAAPGGRAFDPAARNQAGGPTRMLPNPAARADSFARMLAFFREHLAPR
jgi:dienelactone hydrolase